LSSPVSDESVRSERVSPSPGQTSASQTVVLKKRQAPQAATEYSLTLYYYSRNLGRKCSNHTKEGKLVKEPNIKLTKFELEVMKAVWELGPTSIREIQEKLPEKKRPAYTTVQTIIYRLEEKGAVRRVKKIGNAHIFEAAVTKKSAHRRLINELLDLFGGSARPLMAHLVETGKLSLEDVRELESDLLRQQDDQPASSSSSSGGSGSGGRRRTER
jgi:BlaI family transcriptional regulator, penicillinase repressor